MFQNMYSKVSSEILAKHGRKPDWDFKMKVETSMCSIALGTKPRFKISTSVLEQVGTYLLDRFLNDF